MIKKGMRKAGTGTLSDFGRSYESSLRALFGMVLIACLFVSLMQFSVIAQQGGNGNLDQKIRGIERKLKKEQNPAPGWFYLLHALYRKKAKKLRRKSGAGAEQKWKKKAKNTFQKGVKKDMKKERAELILQPYVKRKLIQTVSYESGTTSTNFERLVLQKQVPKRKKKPVLVLYYLPASEDDSHQYAKRAAIILKTLAVRYRKALRFVSYKLPGFNMPQRESAARKDDAKGQNISQSPSMALYGPYDRVKGEHPGNSDGKIKQLDVFTGGPKANQRIYRWIFKKSGKDRVDWIETNLFRKNTERVLRYQNSMDGKWIRIK